MQTNANHTQFFYQNGKLVTLKTGEQGHSIFRSPDVPLPSDNQTTPTPSDCWQLTTKVRCCRYRRKAEALRILRRHCEPNPGSGLGSPVQYDGCYIQDQHTADKQEHDVQIFREHCRIPRCAGFKGVCNY